MSAAPNERPEDIVTRLLDDPDARRALHPHLDRLRQIAPVHRTPLGGALLLTRHRDCASALRDPRLGKGEASADELSAITGAAPLPEVMRAGSLVHLNPPEHTRLRNLVNRAFTPRRVAELEDDIAAQVDELLDGMLERATSPDGSVIDLLDALAFPIPVRVIGDLVGVPEDDQVLFRAWVRAQALAFEPAADEAAMAEARRGAREMAAYFAALVRERRKRPQNDLVSSLLEVRDDRGEPLSKAELVGIPVLLFGAGFETTMNLIGNALAHVLWPGGSTDGGDGGWPDPDAADAAAFVEEVLRFESPVQIDARVALEPTVVAGIDVEPGEWVVALLGAANRDPDVYGPTAGAFVADRFRSVPPPEPVLSFSAGVHHCLGAPLARLEARLVLERLRARGLRLAPVEPGPSWRPTLTSRGLERLPTRVVQG